MAERERLYSLGLHLGLRPLEIAVRNGPPVHFFPDLTGAELLAARRADLAARAPKS